MDATDFLQWHINIGQVVTALSTLGPVIFLLNKISTKFAILSFSHEIEKDKTETLQKIVQENNTNIIEMKAGLTGLKNDVAQLPSIMMAQLRLQKQSEAGSISSADFSQFMRDFSNTRVNRETRRND